MNQEALITVVVPSYNQGQFLEDNLLSIFSQNLPIEVFVIDGGSSDNSLSIIKKYEHKLAGWRSFKDDGQAAAINEGVALGNAPYVCWLNSDDFFYPDALSVLLEALKRQPTSPFVYGKCWTTDPAGKKLSQYLTLPFIPYLFANYCFICQPGTLIRRDSWEKVGGLRGELHMAMDYDLWWRLYRQAGTPLYLKRTVASSRAHEETKTLNNIEQHYAESMDVVKQYWGRLPLKWTWALPLMKIIRRIEKSLYKN